MVLFAFTARSQQLTSSPHTGVEQVPLGDDVYGFLRHLSVRGVIQGYSEAQLPISEFEVAEFLHQADSANLSDAERALVKKYLRTYAHEPRDAVTMFPSKDAEPLFFSGIFTDKDKYLYQWYDDSTKSDLFVDGIGSAEYQRQTDPSSESVKLLNLGGRFSGTLSGHVGYFMQTTNGVALGNKQLALEDPVLSRNNNLRYYSNFFDFTTAELAYTNDWFTGKLAREAVAIGGGYQNDNILLSAAESVPTYDFLSLGAHVGAVRYQSIFASLVPDSLTDQLPYPTKYLAVHDLTFAIGRNLELGYTDIRVITRPDLAYLNPFSFLETVKHALDGTQDQNLGILGTHARWEIVPGIEVRGQAFIQDLVINNIGTGYWSNKGGDQLGAMWAGAFGIPDLDWELEWMRVQPYTYSHWDGVGSYSSSQSLLGAQIGPNAMSYWTELRWAPSAKWIIAFEGQLIERGENVYDSTGKVLYNAGADYRVSFSGDSTSSFSQTYILNGRRVDILNLTLDIEFEPWRGLTIFARGTKSSVNYLNQPPVTPGFDLNGLPVSYAPQSLPETLIAVGARALF
ncbi:MAG TPA: hypothetical protein VFH95_09820 [Candidatus Kapabacteria bacterium]|nr:hypothetical protein [Candidatus Kapabacteria bacterium]